jgi:hypothetical protein
MRGEAHPLVFDTFYSDKPGTRLPDFQNIVVRDFHYIAGGRYGAGTSVFRGYREGETRRPIALTLDGVLFDGGLPKVSGGKDAPQPRDVHLTLRGTNAFAGLVQPAPADDVTVTTIAGGLTAVRDCAGVFVPLATVLAAAQ